MLKMLNNWKWTILLIISAIAMTIFNKTYTMGLLTYAFHIGITVGVIWEGFKALKLINDRKEELPNKVFILSHVALIPLLLIIASNVVMFVWGLISPLETTSVDAKDSLEPGTTYVVYNTDCAYCNASQSNMLRAVSLYNRTHFGKKIKTADVQKHTPVSEKFDSQIDHYGSIVKVDENGALHEAVYTIGDKDGNPLSNSPSNIYERIQKVVNE